MVSVLTFRVGGRTVDRHCVCGSVPPVLFLRRVVPELLVHLPYRQLADAWLGQIVIVALIDFPYRQILGLDDVLPKRAHNFSS